MKEYDISKLVKGRQEGGSLTLPAIEERHGAKTSYLRILRAMLREIGQRGRGARTQFDFDLLSGLAARLAQSAETLVSRILRLESQRHTDTFMLTAKRALGVDLAEVVKQEDLTEYLRLAGTRNAGLIRGLGTDAVKRVQETVSSSMIAGEPARMLQAKLTEQLRISDRRAQLIAQDQIAKLNSDLNRIRHQQAGIDEYIWTTAHDERVRPLHRSLDGRQYRYGESTGAEGGLPPGQPVRCRCIARAVVEF